ncbi:MAG TPA: AAA family ATPase [Actinomycetota bacterium]|jgi:DNA polymerase-3 subunit delta'|nr:AAA family ATPase [Actinomycetota bacterium]
MSEAAPLADAAPVLDRVPGQASAMAFLHRATARPHHAYLFAGPEGGGKSLAARAFAAALLCRRRGCGTCRDCRLALDDRHPNEFLVEPEGRDIHVDTIRSEVWHPAHRTAPEPGRKVFIIREADRLNPAAADTLLKVLEEPPADAVLMLLSARPHELSETILSRCHVVTFQPLAEGFVVETLAAEGAAPERARLAARLSGGNLGRARRLAMDPEGLTFRQVAAQALELAARSAAGGLDAADAVLAAAERYRKGLKDQLEEEIAPFLDDQGRPEDAYRGAIRRLEERHRRRVRRAERDYVDWVLLAMSSLLRDRIVGAVGGSDDLLMNLDHPPAASEVRASALGVAAVEEARAALAEDLNLNPRLLLEHAFLALGRIAA